MPQESSRKVAPDRGYAWVVLGASVGCNYLSGVLVYFVGVIHVELLHKFRGDVTTTAWAGSLYSSLQMLAAPLASALVHGHSCRLSVLAGSVLLCVGFVTSAFATSVLQLVFTYGLIAGTGLGLTYTPSLMVITFYFDKFRGLASGLSVSGFAVGILTGSLMTQAFIDMFSLSGAFFIIAGLGLQGCVFGMLYLPTQHDGRGRRGGNHEERRLNQAENGLICQENGVKCGENGLNCQENGLTHAENGLIHTENGLTRAENGLIHTENGPNHAENGVKYGENGLKYGENGLHCKANGLHHAENSLNHEDKKLNHEGHSLNGVVVAWKSTSSVVSDKLNDDPKARFNQEFYVNGDDKNVPLTLTDDIDAKVFVEKEKNGYDHTTTSSVTSSDEKRATESVFLSVNGNSRSEHGEKGEKRMSGMMLSQEDNQQLKLSEKSCCSKENDHLTSSVRESRMVRTFQGVCSLLNNWAFLIHCCSVFFAGMNMSGVYLHLPEYARLHGTSSTQAAALFVGVGIFSLASRIGSGVLLTSFKVNGLGLSVGLMGLCGVSSCLFPLYSGSYVGQMSFASLFGLSTGGFFTLINVLTVQLVNFHALPAAYGMLIFVMGIGYVTGPPVAGLIVDYGGTYGHSFVFLGLAMFASALFDLFAKIIHKKRKPHQDT